MGCRSFSLLELDVNPHRWFFDKTWNHKTIGKFDDFLHWSLLKEHSKNKMRQFRIFKPTYCKLVLLFTARKASFWGGYWCYTFDELGKAKREKNRSTDIFLSFEGCFTKVPGDRWCFTWWIWKLSSTRNRQKSLCLWKVTCKLALADPKQPVVWAPFTGIWSLPPSPKATFFGSVFFNVLRS